MRATRPPEPLLDRVRAVVGEAARAYADHPTAATAVAEIATRVDEPLRVAVAGRVKSGKSTLLNALVGEPLAATDVGECTRYITWYRHGLVYRTLVHPRDGAPAPVPFHRLTDRIEPVLEGFDADAVERLTVEWPARLLESLTLIDTPGLGSLTATLGERTTGFLVPDDATSPADAVVYLARHLHSADVRFLEAFRDDDAGRPDPVNAVAVLSRADEIGAGRVGAMETASIVADRYRLDPQVRRLCQTVVPVAGLLALGAAQLSEDDFGAFRCLSSAREEDVEAVLLSTDRFGGRDVDVGISLDTRAGLLERYGLFGVRLACSLVGRGEVRAAGELAVELRRRSGVDELLAVLGTQFAARADVLKARAAIAALDNLVHTAPLGDDGRLTSLVEQVQAGAHELAELRLFLALRTGALDLGDDEAAEVEQLLASPGAPASERLGVGADIEPDVATKEIATRVRRWHRRAEHPLAAPATADAARVIIRSYEGMLLELR